MAHNHHEHHHGHKHLHAHGGLKGQVILIIVTILLFIGAVLIEKNCNLPTWQLLLVYLVPYLLVELSYIGRGWPKASWVEISLQ